MVAFTHFPPQPRKNRHINHNEKWIDTLEKARWKMNLIPKYINVKSSLLIRQIEREQQTPAPQ